MASLKEIRARIASVSSTQKLTSAMKMVSAAKLHKSEEATLKFVPYKNKLSDMLSQYLSSVDKEKVNIQITARRGGYTKVYINGEEKLSFRSGVDSINYSSATIGDLRPSRGLKYQGVLYDLAFYNKVLSQSEVRENYNYANSKWHIN